MNIFPCSLSPFVNCLYQMSYCVSRHAFLEMKPGSVWVLKKHESLVKIQQVQQIPIVMCKPLVQAQNFLHIQQWLHGAVILWAIKQSYATTEQQKGQPWGWWPRQFSSPSSVLLTLPGSFLSLLLPTPTSPHPLPLLPAFTVKLPCGALLVLDFRTAVLFCLMIECTVFP